jgi:hypothetical protein
VNFAASPAQFVRVWFFSSDITRFLPHRPARYRHDPDRRSPSKRPLGMQRPGQRKILFRPTFRNRASQVPRNESRANRR